MKPVKTYPAGNDSRDGAAARSRNHKAAELQRRGASADEAATHAGNMVRPRPSGGGC